MTQYNFDTIDPFVVDGVQLASMLNQWRDAIHSMHRGPTRPSYAVPGTMWLDDSGGATNWRVRVFVGGSFDATLASINTSTGAVTLTALGGVFSGNISAQTLALQGTAPEFGMIKSDNGVDLKRWSSGIDGTGRFFLRPLTDGGGGTAAIFYFNRDGTVSWSTVNPSFRLRPTVADVLSGPNTLNMFRSATTPVEDFDIGNNVAITAAGATFTAPTAAKWQFDASIHVTTPTNTNVAPIVRHLTAGSVLIREYFTMGTVFAGVADGQSVSVLINMAAGEKVEFHWQVYAASLVTMQPGTATSTGSWASGHKVSD